MEPESSLPLSQEPDTCPYPERDQSSLSPQPKSFKMHFNTILPSMPMFSMWSHSLRFPHQNFVCTSPLPHTHYIAAHLTVLDFIIRIIYGEKNGS